MSTGAARENTQVGTAALLANISAQLGYRPGEEHIVAIGLRGRRASAHVAAAYDSDVAPYDEFSQYLADSIAEADKHHLMSSWILVGYGPHAEHRVELLTAQLEYDDVRVGEIHTIAGTNYQTLTSDGWSRPAPIGLDEVALATGMVAPLASVDQVRDSLQPDRVPTIWALPVLVGDVAEAATLDRLPPSGRVVRATAILDDLASTRMVGTRSGRSESRLAHLIRSHPAVGRSVVAHAIKFDDLDLAQRRLDVLIDLYKGAAPGIRPDLASVAAATSYHLGRGPVQVQPILDHTRRGDALASHVTERLAVGGNGVAEVAAAISDAQAALRQADAQWTRSRGLGAASLAPGIGQLAPPPPQISDEISLG